MQNDCAGLPFFRITVLDQDTGRGIPLVKLATWACVVYYTDSAGVIAFLEPGLLDQDVNFKVESDGYEIEKDEFGQLAVTLHVTAGGSAVIRMKRTQVAQRLYRITGADIYRDSLLLGDKVPIANPSLNALVTGQDSTLAAVYQNKVFLAWGDTCSPRFHNHWNFKVAGATVELPENGGLDPDRGVDLRYFSKEDGFTKQMAPLPGGFLYWLGGMFCVKDEAGRDRLFASYAKIQSGIKGDNLEEEKGNRRAKKGQMKEIRPASIRCVGKGLVEYSDEKQEFEIVREFPEDAPMANYGHPFPCTEKGIRYLHFGGMYPNVRAKADIETLKQIDKYEGFTCLKQGSRFDCTAEQLDRREDGTLRYSWKTDTTPISPIEQHRLVQEGLIAPEKCWIRFRSVETGNFILTQHHSVRWNAFRKRWVMIVSESHGSSVLGEMLYAEGDTPVGPWVYTQKVATHKAYSCYNPCLHPHFEKDNGRVIYFEGTYTQAFSGAPVGVPRYNYNQVMFKLELDDPRLFLPVPVYRIQGDVYQTNDHVAAAVTRREIPFFAPDRPRAGCVPVYEAVDAKSGARILSLEEPAGKSSVVAFYAEPDNAEPASPATTPLYEYVHRATAARLYTTAKSIEDKAFRRIRAPLCRVWENPITFNPYNID